MPTPFNVSEKNTSRNIGGSAGANYLLDEIDRIAAFYVEEDDIAMGGSPATLNVNQHVARSTAPQPHTRPPPLAFHTSSQDSLHHSQTAIQPHQFNINGRSNGLNQFDHVENASVMGTAPSSTTTAPRSAGFSVTAGTFNLIENATTNFPPTAAALSPHPYLATANGAIQSLHQLQENAFANQHPQSIPYLQESQHLHHHYHHQQQHQHQQQYQQPSLVFERNYYPQSQQYNSVPSYTHQNQRSSLEESPLASSLTSPNRAVYTTNLSGGVPPFATSENNNTLTTFFGDSMSGRGASVNVSADHSPRQESIGVERGSGGGGGGGGAASFGVVGSHRSSTRSNTPHSHSRSNNNSFAGCDFGLGGIGEGSFNGGAGTPNGGDSVSVAPSAANSADLGTFADLEGFGFSSTGYPHSAFYANHRQPSGGGDPRFSSPPPHNFNGGRDASTGQHTSTFLFNSTSASSAPVNGQVSHNEMQKMVAQRRLGAHGGRGGYGLPSFEQADRYMAEFLHYQDQQAEEISYYNEQREQLEKFRKQQQVTQHEQYQGELLRPLYSEFSKSSSAASASAKREVEDHGGDDDYNTNNNPKNNQILTRNQTSSSAVASASAAASNTGTAPLINPIFPFATDIVPVLPSHMSVDPSAGKKKRKPTNSAETTHPGSEAPPQQNQHNLFKKSSSDDNNQPSTLSISPNNNNNNNNNNDTTPAVTSQTASPSTEQTPPDPPYRFPSPFSAMRGDIGLPNMPYVPPPHATGNASTATPGNGAQSKNNKRRKTTTNANGRTRFMPPPPPSLQAARVMAVCLPRAGPGDAYYAKSVPDGGSVAEAREEALRAIAEREAVVHRADPKTCLAGGAFAFLTKTPGTSDWAQGYGASYSATEGEGAPSSTFTDFDPKGEAFQSFLQVLMQWYSRVARVFGHNDPSFTINPEVTTTIDGNVDKKSQVRPCQRYPPRFFSHRTVTPCPAPENYFTITCTERPKNKIISCATPFESAVVADDPPPLFEYTISDLASFIRWHNNVHAWWDEHVRIRTVGHQLHVTLCKNYTIPS